MKGYPQYLWFVVLALLLVCTGCSNEVRQKTITTSMLKSKAFMSKGLKRKCMC